MSWDDLEMVRVNGEFLSLGGGDLWEHVENTAWLLQQLKLEKQRVWATQYRRRPSTRLASNAREREQRRRNKTVDAAVRCCAICRRMYVITLQQVHDKTRFCSRTCAARHAVKVRPPNTIKRYQRLETVADETKPLKDWASDLGIAKGSLYRRIRNGMATATALCTPKIRPAERMVTIGGETKSLNDWARHYGLNVTTVYWRMKNKGMSEIEALTTPRQR